MSLKQQFRQIKKLPLWIYWFPATVLKLYFRLFFRFELIDPQHITDDPHGIIGITWHNRLLFVCMGLKKRALANTSAVISASRDGQYLADFMKFFKINALRGSSSKKGANALLGAIRDIESGRNVVFTPDGPRGPRYIMKNGPVILSAKTGAKIVPFVLNASRCWVLKKSWDQFQIPKPFSKLTLVVGEALSVPADADENEIERFRQMAEKSLLAITADPLDSGVDHK